MKKTQLAKITTILPFDAKYIKVGKNRDKLWNLMDSEGNLISDVWFEQLDKTNDGAIITKAKKNEMRFVNVESFKNYNNVRELVPVSVIGLIDIDTIEPSDYDGYVATARFFGKKIWIKADGRIYDSNGNELRIMFNTVDTLRLNKALLNLNKKLHYDGNYDCEHGWQETIDNKVSIFGFYWIDDDECCVSVGYNKVDLESHTKKWTDDLKIRATLNMPKNMREMLIEKWGTPKVQNEGDFNENYTWTFKKDQLEFIIDTLNNID